MLCVYVCVHVQEYIITLNTDPDGESPKTEPMKNSTSVFVVLFSTTRFPVQTHLVWSHPLSHSHAHKHTSSPQALCCGGNSAGSDIIMPRPLSNVTERSGNVILGNGQHHNIPAWSNCHYCATTTEAKDLGSNN